mgnify:CR=1 FL=1
MIISAAEAMAPRETFPLGLLSDEGISLLDDALSDSCDDSSAISVDAL